MSHFFTHPATTFALGALTVLVIFAVLLTSCSAPNNSAQQVEAFNTAKNAAGLEGPAPNSPAEKEALENFTNFLQKIGDKPYVIENTSKVYSENAYLNDTLVTHHGSAAIQKYFEETSELMTSYKVTIDDISRSGPDHYIRWTMVFAAPKMAGGEPIHSIGISQVRFTPEGKVAFHQDFWDSGSAFFGKLPVSGPAINFIRKRLE